MTYFLTRAINTFVLIAALMVGPVAAQVKTSAQHTRAKQAFVRMENDWLKAIADHDLRTLDRILAAEFTDITYTGELRTREQALARAQAGNQIAAVGKCESKFVRERWRGYGCKHSCGRAIW